MAKQFALAINGKTLAIESEPDTPLLYVLRNDAALSGPKFGCGLGQCGACTVILDGVAVRSCITPIASVGDATITTLEGLGTIEAPHRVQKAFMDEQAAQCGYCTNGMIMTAKALLDANPNPRTDEIKQALSKNLCRCGSHLRIVRAVQRAASGERGQ
jgi:nicotinate dehydrogenase subunit A